MARVPVTEVFLRNSVPPTLRRNLEVFLYKRGTSQKASIFTAEVGGEERAQPLVTDEQGRVKTNLGGTPWVAVGKYTFKGAEGTGVELQWEGAPGAEGGGGGGGEPTGPAGGDLTGEYPNPTIGSEKVTEGKLAALAVSAGKLAANAVTTAKVAGEAVTKEKLSAGVQSELGGSIGAEAVTTEKIANLAVTAAKLAAEAVTEGKIGNLAVGTAKIAANAVTAGKLGSEAVETAAIKALNVTAAKLAAEAVETGKIKLLAITAATIAAEAVEEGKIKALAVSSGKLAAEAVTEGKLAATSVSNAKIVNSTIEEGKLATALLTRIKGAEKDAHGFSMPATTEVKAENIGQFWKGVASGQTIKLVGMKYTLASGTKAKFSIKQNGTAVTSFKELEAKSAEVQTVSGKEVAVADGDLFLLTVESIEGAPKGLSVTLLFEGTH